MILVDAVEIHLSFEKMMTVATEHGYWEISPSNLFDLLKVVEGRQTCGFLQFHQLTLGDPDENWCPDQKYAQVSIARDCQGEDIKSHCCFWNGKNCTSTGAFKHWSTKLEDTGIIRLTRKEAEDWIEERRKSDKQRYFLQERNDSPTGEPYFRICRVVIT